MKINDYKLHSEIQEKEFVENLIYENIGLMNENIELAFENERLKSRLVELDNLYKKLQVKSDLYGDTYTLNFKSKGSDNSSSSSSMSYLDQRMLMALWREKSRDFDKGVHKYSIGSK